MSWGTKYDALYDESSSPLKVNSRVPAILIDTFPLHKLYFGIQGKGRKLGEKELSRTCVRK
jgi:hypothetical protein